MPVAFNNLASLNQLGQQAPATTTPVRAALPMVTQTPAPRPVSLAANQFAPQAAQQATPMGGSVPNGMAANGAAMNAAAMGGAAPISGQQQQQQVGAPAQPAPPPPSPQTIGTWSAPVQPQQPGPMRGAWGAAGWGGAPRPQQPMPAPAAPQAPQPSLEQQALNGGGVDNKQQISNFMNALRQVNGSGNTNAMMQGQGGLPAQAPQPLVSLVGPQATQQFDAGPGAPRPVQVANANNTTAQGLYGGGMFGAAAGTSALPGSSSYQAVPPANTNNTTQQGLYAGGRAGAAAGGSALPGSYQPPRPVSRGMAMDDRAALLNGQMGASAGTAMSDETQKEEVSDASDKLNDFMGKIGAHSYQYKNPEMDGHGTFTSPMAQELQKTELGKQAVIETPRGLMVDYARLGGVNLAAVSVVHREQQKLAAQVERMRAELRRRKG